MKKLNVPLKRQLEGSVECGQVCLQMIYSYYAKPKDIEQLRGELPTTSIGTYSPQLGLHFLKNGFKVEIITYNPRLVGRNDSKLSQQELLDKFDKMHKNANKNDKLVLTYFIDFIKKGGKMTVKIPSKKDIEEEIKEKRPLIATITMVPLYMENILEKKPIDDTFHFVVITGVESNKV